MGRGLLPAAAGIMLVVGSSALAACGTTPAPRAAPRTTTSSTTTTTAPPRTTVVTHGVAVPNVIGMKIAPARFYLRAAGFAPTPFNKPCSAGTLASQSVVVSLSVPGKPPNVTVGALPLVPGTSRPKGSRVEITWSECYPGGTQVPEVAGQTFPVAVRLLHQAGLNWACYSVGTPTTTHPPTTTLPPTTTTTTSAHDTSSTTATTTTTTTNPPTTTTTTSAPKAPQTVLSQNTPAGTTVRAATVVSLVMHHCPQ